MLEYRIRRLPAALERARTERHAGARFPWESAASGAEVTPRSVVDRDGALVPIRTGTDELHIVGDVAWAAWCYGEWTGDDDFRRGPGHRLLVETARYWASRVRADGSGVAHLFGVIGPDEYHEPVDDNALHERARAVEPARGRGVGRARPVATTSTRTDAARWLDLADALVDGYDPDTGIYEQFAGFFALEPLRIADIAARPVTADLLLGRERVRGVAGREAGRRADAAPPAPGRGRARLAASQPRLLRTANRTRQLTVTRESTPRSSPAPAAWTEAVELLRIAARIDLDDIGQTGAGGVHLAAMGTVWQAFAFGFIGARPRGDVLVLDPKLPAAWSELEQRLEFRGTSLRVRTTPDAVIVTSSAPVELEVNGQRALSAGETRFPNERGRS